MRICTLILILTGFTSLAFGLDKDEQAKVVERARLEVKRQVQYDASYRQIKYPNGDVDEKKGVCTDVVIRALRSIGIDLQKAIYLDKKSHRRFYDKTKADTNIDHRRCRNQIAYFNRFAQVLTKDYKETDQWQPGDIVYWDLDGKGLLHTGIISDVRNEQGVPYVIHNIGPKASEEDALWAWKIIAHFRLDRTKAAK